MRSAETAALGCDSYYVDWCVTPSHDTPGHGHLAALSTRCAHPYPPALPCLPHQVVEFEGVDARYSIRQLRDSDRHGLMELEGQPDGL